jgi:GNAT superfamily N-acetyltransferase
MRLLAATAEQQERRDAMTAEVWASPLSKEQFYLREKRLRQHRWAKRTMTSWLWCDGDGAVLSSCEAFVDDAIVGARRGTAVTIASVFTEATLRGHGHAGQMLEAVANHAQREHTCLAIVLFSEIGPRLYQRQGFYPVPAFDTFFPPSAQRVDGVEWVDGQLPSPQPVSGDDETLRLTLSQDRLDWHLERERFVGTALSRGPLRTHGARVGEDTITWTAYWKTDELQVLSFDSKSSENSATLIRAARWAAHEAGLARVRVWETSALSQFGDAVRRPRTDEIAMFRPVAPGIHAWTNIERGLWA